MKASRHRRQLLLLGVVGGLVMLVAFDRAGFFVSAQDEGTSDARSARSRYLDRAVLWRQQRELLAQSESWADAADRAQRVWNQAQQLVFEAPTVELAGARFRDRVVEELRLLGVESPRATLLNQVEAATLDDAGSPLREIAMDLRFDVQSHRDLYSAIDRLENLPGAWTAIESIDVTGPGRIQVPLVASVSLRLVALGLIRSEARAEVGP